MTATLTWSGTVSGRIRPIVPQPRKMPAIRVTTNNQRNETIKAAKIGMPFAPLMRALTADLSAQKPSEIKPNNIPKAIARKVVN